MAIDEAWQRQLETLKRYQATAPDLVKPKVKRTEAEIFDEIGILNIPKDRPKGYIRLYPDDFIVEEKNYHGISKVNDIQVTNPFADEENKYLHAHLVKIGIPTTLAIERVGEALEINPRSIGYGGLKDADALTAQLVTFASPKLKPEEIDKIKIPNILLTKLHYGSKMILPGSLDANSFTITIRTAEPIDESRFNVKIDMIAKFGVLNYFNSQRFRTLRLISHKLGKLIYQGNYELAIKYFLFKTSEEDIDLITNIRKEAEKNFADLAKLETLYSELPYTFPNELKIVRHLKDNPNDFVGALAEIKDQTQLWIYAYASLLFNLHLSTFSLKHGVVDEKFPLLLSDDPNDVKIYQPFLEEDKADGYKKTLAPFKFLQFKKRLIDGRIFPGNLNYKSFEDGVVLNFTLGKGSYATTLLSNLFEIYESTPVPEWVKPAKIDPKTILKQGDLSQIREVFKEYYYSKLDNNLS